MNDTFSYTIRRNPRMTRIRLTIRHGEVRISAPVSASNSIIEQFLRQHHAWIMQKLAAFRQIQNKIPRYEYIHGEKFPLLGKQYTLVIQEGTRKSLLLKVIDDQIVIWLPAEIKHGDRAKTIRTAIINWYRKQAVDIFTQRTSFYNCFYGFSYQKIFIRNQKTRWGSCSANGNLSYNYRLLLAPLNILDYVVVHELVHLKEKNHGRNFWHLVAAQIPDYKERRLWLKQNGHTLVI